MRRLFVLGCLAAAACVFAVTSARGTNGDSSNFRVTLSLTQVSSAGGIGYTMEFRGESLVPMIGKASITGVLEAGCSFDVPSQGDPSVCHMSFTMNVVAASSGRSVVIEGSTGGWYQFLEPAPEGGTWTTTNTATKDGLVGQGTFTMPLDRTVVPPIFLPYPVFTITLTGSLTPAAAN